jgi:hypothetical protein
MQQLKHTQFITVPTGRQVWNERSSLHICRSYVPLGIGFTAKNMSNDNSIRPWMER